MTTRSTRCPCPLPRQVPRIATTTTATSSTGTPRGRGVLRGHDGAVSQSTGDRRGFQHRPRAVAIAEERQTRNHGGIQIMDVTRFTQNGTWEGWVAIDGVRIELDPRVARGTRDRSWGPVSTSTRSLRPFARAPTTHTLITAASHSGSATPRSRSRINRARAGHATRAWHCTRSARVLFGPHAPTGLTGALDPA